MSIKKLNKSGFTHMVALIAVVVVFAVAGVAYMIASHANSICSSTSTQTINGVTTTNSSTSCNTSTCIVNGVQQSSCPRPTTPSPSITAGTKLFSGKVTHDSCVGSTLPIGDTGCVINVAVNSSKNYEVRIVHGNTNTPVWGKLYGFTATTDITGKKVSVRAVPSKTQPGSFDLSNRSAYVRAY